MNLIGHITLNISTVIYLIRFAPQIFLNFRRKDTSGLSMLMFGILCIGYLSDLMYGFGLHMQWQYKMVTIVGLFSLALQHFQFGRYGLQRLTEKFTYIFLSFIFLILFFYAIYVIKFSSYDRSFYDFMGMVENVCWVSCMLPQIIKNYFNKSTQGLSTTFIFLAVFLNICDFISAWMLGWDYPSKIGPIISLTANLILIAQIFYYGIRDKQLERLHPVSSRASAS